MNNGMRKICKALKKRNAWNVWEVVTETWQQIRQLKQEQMD